jgi:hypothetical protein
MPPGVFCPASLLLLLLSLAFSRTAGFGSPTARAALEHVPMVQQAIEHGGDSGAVAEQLAPVFHWSVRCEQGAGALVTAHDDLQQFLGSGERQLAHADRVADYSPASFFPKPATRRM